MIPVIFFKSNNGTEPVKEWLDKLPEEERITIMEDIQTVRRGWPIGMPLVKKNRNNVWEIRSKHKDRISRVLFALLPIKNDKGKKFKHAVLLHGFIKKSKETPDKELKLAIKRAKAL